MRCYLRIVCLCLLLVSQSNADEHTLSFHINCDIGPDRGQSFGSLFEVRDEKNRAVIGAGFQDVYNTRFRNSRLTLQFFVRPATAKTESYKVARLPHPDLDCGIYLFDYQSQIYAWTSIRNNSVRRWNAQANKWVKELPPGVTYLRGGDGVMNLGDGRLVFSNNRVRYNGKVILQSKDTDYCYYYAHGHLFFYRRVDKKDATYVYACPWLPGQGKVDLGRAVVLKAKYPRETPFSWGQFNQQVLSVSNQGGVYVFDSGKWSTLLESDNKVSYQVYSMLRWYDRLLLAQYPTGNVFDYRGKGKPIQLKGWPPRLKGVSPSARECQTLSIYRGELFAGVWPWAEVWRYDGDTWRWHFVGRGFTHPKLTDKRVHPYEQHTKRFRLVSNHWGQRITSMIPLGPSLYMSTSAKGTYPWKDEYKFLSDKQRREYGSMLKMRLDGNLSVPLRWNGGKLNLRLSVSNQGTMAVYQNGRRLASTKTGTVAGLNLRRAKPKWSTGIFGPFSGRFEKRGTTVHTK